MGDGHTKVFIASANSIFRNGIEKILSKRSDFNTLRIHQFAKLEDLIKKFSRIKPSILIIDFDDKNLNKRQFLDSFINEKWDTQLLLVTLKEGGNVVLYKKQIFSVDQAFEWLMVPWNEDQLLDNLFGNDGGS
jgi:DNA-binding NarL/FixJ family response regulator